MSIRKRDIDKYPARKEQIDALEFIKLQHKNNKKFILLNLPTGTGKAQPLYSKILTPSGWNTFRNLKEGDEVITPSGQVSKIIKLHNIETLPTYTITFSDGRNAQCTENHLWKVYHDDYISKWKVIPLKNVIHKFISTSKRSDGRKLYVPLVIPQTTNDVDLPMHPYVIGCLIGDGGLTQESIKFTSADNFIIDKMKSILEKYDISISNLSSNYGYYISYKINPILKKLGLFGKKSEFKFIPDLYKNISFNQKIDLLNGLIDTDGTICENGSIEFYSSSYQLIKDVQELVWSIGGIAKISEKKAKYRDKNDELKDGLLSYRLRIRYHDMKLISSLPRKKERISENHQYKNLRLSIKDIVKDNEKTETRCISIDHPDELYITDNYIVTHNSHLAMMISDWYINQVNRESHIDIITAGKILQDQYNETYDSINNLKGKDNYECEQYNCSCLQGKEFNKLNKTKCEGCPYDVAKECYMGGKISLTNFYLYLIYSMYSKKENIQKREANVLIVDEAHEFDDVMSDFISIRVSEPLIKKYKLAEEDQLVMKLNKVKDINDYIKFLEVFNQELIHSLESLDTSAKSTKDIKILNLINDLKQTLSKVEIFLEEYKASPHNWVLETSVNDRTKHREFSMEPIWAYDYLEKYVWSRYEFVILMSGTILDKHIFSELNGLHEDESAYYSINSPFPLKNRPIYYMPLGKMSYAKKEETFKNYIPYINKIVAKYNDSKGIIHTNSFELSKWIQSSVTNNRLIFHDSASKTENLRFHFETERPTVFVSPSVGTGVSFDDDRARFQIVAKIPYPSLASQKNKLRQKTNPNWYSWKTVCNLLQIFGRCVRSMEDTGHTIVIDGSFSDLLRYSSNYIPGWVQDSIKKVDVKV